ncbi:MAG: hypothetical protein OZSIB_0966 [Candidatus Ozemobacter sibiricus]|jgi:uncharacterized protein YbcI|uniref:Na+-translocating membrane potential-generating system MpsC domain-containing protein n=1 Tax=Candidatus Ozemobacter sibiricus TaxID=2268124 RepID=A0A367ZL44_9BACT|nr:MAG: hypothetical protein OZSIB_0966 [Candidatus Ozemobacter sibiricus]
MKRHSPTKGQLEAAISEAVVQFEQEFMGRGPLEARTFIVDDMVIIRLRGVLTPAEHQLAKTVPVDHGRELIKKMRETLIERGRPLLEAALERILGRKAISMHTDISTRTGERVIIFVMDCSPRPPER